jgi:hypothetical protein
MVHPVLLVKTVDPVKTVLQAQPAHLVLQGAREDPDQTDHEVIQAETLAELNHNPEMLDQQAQTVNQARKVQLEMQARTVAKAPTDPKDHQALLVKLAKTVNQEIKDHQVSKAKLEKKVSAPNTALSMVAYFSKMVQDDKCLVVPGCSMAFNVLCYFILKSILFSDRT